MTLKFILSVRKKNLKFIQEYIDSRPSVGCYEGQKGESDRGVCFQRAHSLIKIYKSIQDRKPHSIKKVQFRSVA